MFYINFCPGNITNILCSLKFFAYLFSGLNCTGVIAKPSQEEHFTTSTIINYCSHPTTLELHIDVPKENMHIDHIFRDGDKFEVSKAYNLYITVHLKRQPKYINVTVTLTVDVSGCNFLMFTTATRTEFFYSFSIRTSFFLLDFLLFLSFLFLCCTSFLYSSY